MSMAINEAAQLDDCLALDRLNTVEPALAAGLDVDLDVYRRNLAEARRHRGLIEVRRGGELQAYAAIKPLNDDHWFVLMYSLHPRHRNAAVMRALLSGLTSRLNAARARRLSSHVLHNNTASLALHRKLGFTVMQCNEKGVEFELDICSGSLETLLQRLNKSRTVNQLGNQPYEA